MKGYNSGTARWRGAQHNMWGKGMERPYHGSALPSPHLPWSQIRKLTEPTFRGSYGGNIL